MLSGTSYNVNTQPRLHPEPANASRLPSGRSAEGDDRSIKLLQGPILILGAESFLGANLYATLRQVRQDVYPATYRQSASGQRAWRHDHLAATDVPSVDWLSVDWLSDASLKQMLDDIKPRTVFNLVSPLESYPATTEDLYTVALPRTDALLALLENRDITCYEQIFDCGNSDELLAGMPDSAYGVARIASSALIHYYGRTKLVPCVSVYAAHIYGPMQDLDEHGTIPVDWLEDQMNAGSAPADAERILPRDALFVGDACNAIVQVAIHLREEDYGATIEVDGGHSNGLATQVNWQPTIDQQEGLAETLDWYRSIGGYTGWQRLSAPPSTANDPKTPTKNSISAIIACYNEGPSIPFMYKRLQDVFTRLAIDYEIIFVNNGSTDNSEELIRELSSEDHSVIGITHSRSFGAETSYRSGLEIASKEACVLLDGDLQDPPEMIEQFVEKWREGYEVVYGRRVKRDAPLFMQICYKLFYRLFSYFSYVPMPRDAGDFSLIDRRAVDTMLRFKERDLWLRGIRAYVGFRQTGVDYVRPERMFGRTSNNIFKNIGWAKKGILSFTRMPLDVLSYAAVILVLLSIVLGALQVTLRILFPQWTAWGVTTMLVVILFFGSINLFAISLVGEYIAKIFDEVKQRPLYIRRSVIMDGEVKPIEEVFPGKELA